MRRADTSIAIVLAAGFLLRVTIRLWMGEADFIEHGYSFYVRMARAFLDGQGFCLAPGFQCAARVPGYSLLLAPFEAAGWLYPGMVFVQASIGTGTAWVAWALGRRLFDGRAGLLAASLTAFNPYALVHDTALQDTSLLNLLVALAVLLLLKLSRQPSSLWAVGAGLSMALAVLTAARASLLLPGVFLWIWFNAGPTRTVRLRHTAIVGMIVVMLVGGWTVRNGWHQGAWTLTTESGRSLWIANNEWTFTHFPSQSIDLSAAESFNHLSELQQHQLALVANDEVARDRLLAGWAVNEISHHALRTVSYAMRKIWVVVSGQLSPARGLAVQLSYTLVFASVNLLALVGLWRSRGEARSHSLVYSIFVGFTVTTAIFWAHTSHKSFLDAFLFVYAAAALEHAWPFVAPWARSATSAVAARG